MTELPRLMNPAAKLGARTFTKNGVCARVRCAKHASSILSGQIVKQDKTWTAAPSEREKVAVTEQVRVCLTECLRSCVSSSRAESGIV
jgi:hypothetical protein